MLRLAVSFLLVVFTSSLFAQNYRVVIATFATSEMPDVIKQSNIPGIFRKVDQNKLYHYYLGDYYTEAEAEEVRVEMLMKGFIDAKVIDLEEQKLWCGAPCPYFKDDYVYNLIGSDGLMVGAVFFLNGGAVVSKKGSKTIYEFAKVLKNHPDFRLHLGGHADAKGAQKANIYIAGERLRSVIKLLKRYGVLRKDIIPVIFGEGMPLGGDLKYDRRVVLTILDSSGQVVSRNRATMPLAKKMPARR
ncbi:MAG TPA: hypothetical protein ENK85_00620 [Saprospiraceae bacterium]|nr:hypothetical protein [Saprospiraceae bacterium]